MIRLKAKKRGKYGTGVILKENKKNKRRWEKEKKVWREKTSRVLWR